MSYHILRASGFGTRGLASQSEERHRHRRPLLHAARVDIPRRLLQVPLLAFILLAGVLPSFLPLFLLLLHLLLTFLLPFALDEDHTRPEY